MAALGCALAISAFWIFGQARYAQLLKLQVSKETMLKEAERQLKASPIAKHNPTLDIETNFDKDLFRFAQKYLGNKVEQASGKMMLLQFDWDDEISMNGETQTIRFQLDFDGTGRQAAFQKKYPELPDSTNLEIEEAVSKAKMFLFEKGIDTTGIPLAQKSSEVENDIQTHRIRFERKSSISDSLKEFHGVSIAGNTILGYSSGLEINEENFKFPKFEDTFNIVTAVGMAIIWSALIITLIVILFKRLRHDEIDFQDGIWFGVIVGFIFWISVALQSWPKWEVILFGGGFGGVFVAAGVIIGYAVAESLSRDVWPEKMKLFEQGIRGRLRFKEMGAAILRALIVSGIAIFSISAMAWFIGEFSFGYINLENDRLWIFEEFPGAIGSLMENIFQAVFTTLLFLSFLVAYIRSKTNRLLGILAITTAVLILSGLIHILLEPGYFSMFLMLPVALLFAYVMYKYDFMTTFLAGLLGFIYLDFNLIAIHPDGVFGLAGIMGLLLLLAIFATGVALVFNKQTLADVEEYVPEYVSRIAERERINKELEIARNIQFQFLPSKQPDFPGLDIASICKPAMEVGGDYYDFVHGVNDRLSVIIGDVSGKGVSAAFYMTMTKGIIRTLSKWINEPAKVLTELNEVFYNNSPRNIFISMLYGIFDMKNRTLTFSRAGHNPLMVRKGKIKEMEMLNPQGIAIGMDKGEIFAKMIREETVAIEPGDVFIFYTDGISEAMNGNGEEFGEDRLAETLNQYARLSAQEILESISKTVFDFAGNTPQHDDFTMVVVKVGD